MIEWLQNYQSFNSDSYTQLNTERAELEFLRKEIFSYERKFKSININQTKDENNIIYSELNNANSNNDNNNNNDMNNKSKELIIEEGSKSMLSNNNSFDNKDKNI